MESNCWIKDKHQGVRFLINLCSSRPQSWLIFSFKIHSRSIWVHPSFYINVIHVIRSHFHVMYWRRSCLHYIVSSIGNVKSLTAHVYHGWMRLDTGEFQRYDVLFFTNKDSSTIKPNIMSEYCANGLCPCLVCVRAWLRSWKKNIFWFYIGVWWKKYMKILLMFWSISFDQSVLKILEDWIYFSLLKFFIWEFWIDFLWYCTALHGSTPKSRWLYNLVTLWCLYIFTNSVH